MLVPDGATADFAVTACDPGTGVLTLGPTTAAETGSSRTCTAAGCLFGAPLPTPNPASTATSTCLVQTLAADAAGSASCTTGGVSTLSLALDSGVYLGGDLFPAIPGIQPCPLCQGTCQGGPNAGAPCTPDTSAAGDQHPTSHDCPPAPATFVGTVRHPAVLTTGTTVRTAVDLPGQTRVFCGFCATTDGVFENPAVPCTSDAACTNGSFTSCRQRNPGAFGTSVTDAREITVAGVPAGCIDDGGPHAITLAGAFCEPPTYNGLLDNAADLPGPGALSLTGSAQLIP
jgi:hypothetical protein